MVALDSGVTMARDKVVYDRRVVVSDLEKYIFKQVTRWRCNWTVPRGAAGGAGYGHGVDKLNWKKGWLD